MSLTREAKLGLQELIGIAQKQIARSEQQEAAFPMLYEPTLQQFAPQDTTLSDMEAEVEAKVVEADAALEAKVAEEEAKAAGKDQVARPEDALYVAEPLSTAVSKPTPEEILRMPEAVAAELPIKPKILTEEVEAELIDKLRKIRDYRIQQATGPPTITALPEDEPETVGQALRRIFIQQPMKAVAGAGIDQEAIAHDIAKRLARSGGMNYDQAYAQVISGFKKEARAAGYLQGPDLGEIISVPITLLIAAGLSYAPLATLKGIGKFIALDEADNLAASFLFDKQYRPMGQEGLLREVLAPEGSPSHIRELAETIDFMVKIGVVAGGPKLWKAFTKDIVRSQAPQIRVYLSPKKVRQLHKEGKLELAEEADLAKALGMKSRGTDWEAAVKEGLIVEFPVQNIVKMADKPWYGKVKHTIGIGPLEPPIKTTVTMKGKPQGIIQTEYDTYRQPFKAIPAPSETGEAIVRKPSPEEAEAISQPFTGRMPEDSDILLPEAELERVNREIQVEFPEKPPEAAERPTAEKPPPGEPEVEKPEPEPPLPEVGAKEEVVPEEKPTEQMEREKREETRRIKNQSRLEAIRAAVKAGKSIVHSTQYRSTKIGLPEHIRLSKSGELQIIEGRKWVYITDQDAENLARKAGQKIPEPWEEEEPKVPIELPPKEYKAGKKGKAYLPDNTPVEFEYTIVELEELTASHTIDLAVNEAYPSELQPRDRTRKAMQLLVDKIAKNPIAEKLMESPAVSIGAPFVGKDLLIESGSGRVIALEKAYNQKGPAIELYKRTMYEEAERFGLNPEEIAKMKRPILVRVRTTEVEDRVEFARKANQPEVATMSPVETAKSDAKRMADEDFNLFAPSMEGNIGAASNRMFVAKFLENLGTEEAAGLSTAEGGFTKKLFDRIQAAIFYRAYQDESLLTLMAEEADPNIKNILNALTVAAGEFAKARIIIKDATTVDNIISHIVGAVKLIQQARRDQTLSVDMLIEQIGLFEQIPDTKRIAKFLNENKRSGVRMGEFFKELALIAQRQIVKSTNQDLFGTGDKLSPSEIIESAIKKVKAGYEKPTEKAPGLFDSEEVDVEGGPKGEPVEGKGAEAGAAEELKKPPAGFADTGGYADIGGYEAPPTPEGEGPRAMDLPEIVELARQLMKGKLPRIKKYLGIAAGRFKHKGKKASIELLASIFKDPVEAAKVLAHEIGHLVDWLPDKTIARGNILGRIASLKKYMKKYLENRPGAAGPLTDEDRVRLKKVARQLAEKEADKLIDEEITKEIPLTPEDILAIWNDATFDIKKNEALYRYIQELTGAEKKSIVREAFRGIVPRRLKQFAKTIKEKTGRKIKEKASAAKIEEKYKKLILEEIEKRRLFQLDAIMNELIDFTHLWKPFDSMENPAYTRYRYSSPELYADALSALITNPGYLRDKCPRFYEGFFNYLERKPEVRTLYEQIQNEIKSGAEQSSLVNRTRKGFLKREEEYRQLLRKKREGLTDKDGWGTFFIDRHFAIIRRVNKIGESNIPDNFNPVYKLEDWRHSGTELEGYLVDLNKAIFEPLKKAGLTHFDIGEYLMHTRIATERAEFANPLGWTPERSKQRIKEMEATFGPILKELKAKFRGVREEWLITKIKESEIYSPDLTKTIIENKDYATFSIIGHLEKSYGRVAASHIFRQIGTFTETGDPFTATVLKDLLIMRSINKQIAAESVVKFFEKHYPKEIKPAEKDRQGHYMESGDPDFKLVGFLKHGEFKGYYLPRYVAEAFRQNPIESMIISKILRNMGTPFRAVFTQFNPGFWIVNLRRDYKAAAKQLPGLTMAKFLPYYLKAIPAAFRSTFGTPDAIAKQALKDKTLISVASYHHDVPEDLEFERLLKRHSLTRLSWRRKIVRPITFLLDTMSKMAQAMERLPKIAGGMYMKEKFPRMSEERRAHIVRSRAGSPDFLRTGTGSPIYNNLFLFSNAMKEGLRSAYEAGSENFSEYAWKTVKYNLLWKTFVYGATLGLAGFGMKKLFDNISDYDKANYNCIPVGVTETGKTVYWRIPQDEQGRMIGALYHLALTKGRVKDFASIFDYMAGQVPSLNPGIEVAWAAVDYFSGQNPYDHFRGRNVINKDVFVAGGERSDKAFAKWVSNQFGGSIIHRFKHDGIKEVQSELEGYLNLPIVNNMLGRFLKVSDYGLREKLYAELDKVASIAAEERLVLNEAVVKMLEGKGGELTKKEMEVLADRIESLPYYTQKVLAYKFGNVYMQKFVTARSKEEKEIILKQMIANVPYDLKTSIAEGLDNLVDEIRKAAKKIKPDKK